MNRQKKKNGVIAGILLPMGLVCLFAFCSLALAIFGGNAYKNIQADVDDSYHSNVAASYLRTRLGQAQGSKVELRDEDGIQVLAIGFYTSGVEYETRIFMNNGQLLEVFERADNPFTVIGGVEIAQLQSCTFSLSEDGLFEAELVSPAGSKVHTAVAVSERGSI